jgi:hypothetical protein
MGARWQDQNTRVPAREASFDPVLVYALGALRADRDGGRHLQTARVYGGQLLIAASEAESRVGLAARVTPSDERLSPEWLHGGQMGEPPCQAAGRHGAVYES